VQIFIGIIKARFCGNMLIILILHSEIWDGADH
jgi:hypothetical protein